MKEHMTNTYCNNDYTFLIHIHIRLTQRYVRYSPTFLAGCNVIPANVNRGHLRGRGTSTSLEPSRWWWTVSTKNIMFTVIPEIIDTNQPTVFIQTSDLDATLDATHVVWLQSVQILGATLSWLIPQTMSCFFCSENRVFNHQKSRICWQPVPSSR